MNVSNVHHSLVSKELEYDFLTRKTALMEIAFRNALHPVIAIRHRAGS